MRIGVRRPAPKRRTHREACHWNRVQRRTTARSSLYGSPPGQKTTYQHPLPRSDSQARQALPDQPTRCLSAFNAVPPVDGTPMASLPDATPSPATAAPCTAPSSETPATLQVRRPAPGCGRSRRPAPGPAPRSGAYPVPRAGRLTPTARRSARHRTPPREPQVCGLVTRYARIPTQTSPARNAGGHGEAEEAGPRPRRRRPLLPALVLNNSGNRGGGPLHSCQPAPGVVVGL